MALQLNQNSSVNSFAMGNQASALQNVQKVSSQPNPSGNQQNLKAYIQDLKKATGNNKQKRQQQSSYSGSQNVQSNQTQNSSNVENKTPQNKYAAALTSKNQQYSNMFLSQLTSSQDLTGTNPNSQYMSPQNQNSQNKMRQSQRLFIDTSQGGLRNEPGQGKSRQGSNQRQSRGQGSQQIQSQTQFQQQQQLRHQFDQYDMAAQMSQSNAEKIIMLNNSSGQNLKLNTKSKSNGNQPMYNSQTDGSYHLQISQQNSSGNMTNSKQSSSQHLNKNKIMQANLQQNNMSNNGGTQGQYLIKRINSSKSGANPNQNQNKSGGQGGSSAGMQRYQQHLRNGSSQQNNQGGSYMLNYPQTTKNINTNQQISQIYNSNNSNINNSSNLISPKQGSAQHHQLMRNNSQQQRNQKEIIIRKQSSKSLLNKNNQLPQNQLSSENVLDQHISGNSSSQNMAQTQKIQNIIAAHHAGQYSQQFVHLNNQMTESTAISNEAGSKKRLAPGQGGSNTNMAGSLNQTQQSHLMMTQGMNPNQMLNNKNMSGTADNKQYLIQEIHTMGGSGGTAGAKSLGANQKSLNMSSQFGIQHESLISSQQKQMLQQQQLKHAINSNIDFNQVTQVGSSNYLTLQGRTIMGAAANGLNLSSLLRTNNGQNLLEEDGIEDLHFCFVSFNQHKNALLKAKEKRLSAAEGKKAISPASKSASGGPGGKKGAKNDSASNLKILHSNPSPKNQQMKTIDSTDCDNIIL